MVAIVYRTVFFFFKEDCHTSVVLRTFITLLCLAFIFLLKISFGVKQKCVELYIGDRGMMQINGQ